MRKSIVGGLLSLCLSSILVAQDLPEQYREPFAKSWPIRRRQHLQLKEYLERIRPRTAADDAQTFPLDFSGVAEYQKSLEPIREHLMKSKGLPPDEALVDPKPRFELVGHDQHADVYRVWTEVFRGVEAYAIYMVPRALKGKAPVIIAVHGGSGCPEAVCDLDTRENYRSFGPEAVKRGYIVYAPGLLMNVSYAEPKDPRLPDADWQALAAQAAERGMSTRDLQVYQIIAGAKAVIAARTEADGSRIGMTGLSMGGAYTLFTVPLWPEIKAAVAAAGLRAPEDSSVTAPHTFASDRDVARNELIALICPRPLMIQSGKDDSVVPLADAEKAIPQARMYYERLGVSDRFEFNVHAGGHVFENDAIFRFFDEHLRQNQAR